MNDINLLLNSKDNSISGGKISRSIVVALIALGIIVIAGGAYGSLHLTEMNKLEVQMQLDKDIKFYSEINETKKSLQSYRDRAKKMGSVMDVSTKSSIQSVLYFDKLSAIIPEGVFFVNYSITKSGEMNIAAKSKDNKSIADFIFSIGNLGIFEDVALKSISNTSSDSTKQTELNFVLVLKLRQ